MHFHLISYVFFSLQKPIRQFKRIMPRKNAMRDNVSAVRSRLPHLSNLPREKIELALLYYESNIDETVEAFKRSKLISIVICFSI